MPVSDRHGGGEGGWIRVGVEIAEREGANSSARGGKRKLLGGGKEQGKQRGNPI